MVGSVPLAWATLLAGTAGGTTAGAIIGWAGGVLTLNTRVVIVIIAAAFLAIGPLIWPKQLPQLNRETEQDLLGRGPFTWALVNGYLLGLGFTSRIGYWIFYLVPLGCLAGGSLGLGALIWGTYGFTRLGAVYLLALQMHGRPGQMGDLSQRLLALRPAVRRLTNPAAALCSLTVVLLLGL